MCARKFDRDGAFSLTSGILCINRLDTRRKEILSDNTGIRVKVKVVKNKVATPFKSVMVDILFGTGLDKVGCILDAALEMEVIERRGSWFSYKSKNLAQGRQNVVALLKSDPKIAEQVESDVKAAFSKLEPEVVATEEEEDLSAKTLDEGDASNKSVESFLE